MYPTHPLRIQKIRKQKEKNHGSLKGFIVFFLIYRFNYTSWCVSLPWSIFSLCAFLYTIFGLCAFLHTIFCLFYFLYTRLFSSCFFVHYCFLLCAFYAHFFLCAFIDYFCLCAFLYSIFCLSAFYTVFFIFRVLLYTIVCLLCAFLYPIVCLLCVYNFRGRGFLAFQGLNGRLPICGPQTCTSADNFRFSFIFFLYISEELSACLALMPRL